MIFLEENRQGMTHLDRLHQSQLRLWSFKDYSITIFK
jgi:hypothetical protein